MKPFLVALLPVLLLASSVLAQETPPMAVWATQATPHVVTATRPMESSEIGRRFARRSRSPVKNADE